LGSCELLHARECDRRVLAKMSSWRAQGSSLTVGDGRWAAYFMAAYNERVGQLWGPSPPGTVKWPAYSRAIIGNKPVALTSTSRRTVKVEGMTGNAATLDGVIRQTDRHRN